MSFRLFIYYCALCGAWAALFGWALGRAADVEDPIPKAGIRGFCLGLFVSFGLGVVDSLWNLSSFRQVIQAFLRVFVATVVGSIGGMMGGIFGQILYGNFRELSIFLIIGWTMTGLLIGVSVGAYDVLQRLMQHEDIGGAIRKVINGGLGGTLGGALGGICSVFLHKSLSKTFGDRPIEQIWSPTGIGFVILGMCIGLLIGLAQIILKEAWVKVENGRRAGKEMIINKQFLTIGRAEICDLGLFGYEAVEKMHAKIIEEADGFYLDDAGTPGGTFLNGKRINEPTPLRGGDLIRLGNALVRFGERAKH